MARLTGTRAHENMKRAQRAIKSGNKQRMTATFEPNETLLKFGYPASLIREYEHWVVLLRPKQATLGALVLACKEEAQAFSQISHGAFIEQEIVVRDIEQALSQFHPYDKINYLMLMMVDLEVHTHVLPRYGALQVFAGESFEDPGWPAVPDLAAGPLLENDALQELVDAIKAHWPQR